MDNLTYKHEKATTKPDGEVVISVETWDFELTPQGHINCLECSTKIWCQHIAEVVSKDADAPQFFDFTDQARPIQHSDFIIIAPIFPTMNIWRPVSLIARPELHAIEVDIQHGIDPKNKPDYVQVGFIHPGEGRGVIRELIFDWFRAEFATTRFVCQSASHKPAQEAALQKMMQVDKTFLMARYTIWNSAQCPPCIQGIDEDFSDLVPDKESNIWNRP